MTRFRVYITKSKSGHYTVTIWEGNQRRYWLGKLPHIERARSVASEWIAGQETVRVS